MQEQESSNMSTSRRKQVLKQQIERLGNHVVHVRYSIGSAAPKPSALIDENWAPPVTDAYIGIENPEQPVFIHNQSGQVILTEAGHAMETKETFGYVIDGEPAIRHKHTANGDVAYISNAHKQRSGSAYHGRIIFRISSDEHLYGLGQHDNGIYDYREQHEYLFQTNMKISAPFLISSKNYGLLIDTESALVFSEQNGEMRFELETVNELSYYIITGESFDEIIATLRLLTGRAPMLPRWAFGYIQSKERYHSSKELTDAANMFRALCIPVDCLVQDWYTWEDGLWGEKSPDPKRYPDLQALTNALHTLHTRLMVSIWPNMTPKGTNLLDFQKQNLLLPNSFVYNAYEEAGRALYWKQCEEYWFRVGIDAWWCDNAEPFSDTDWCGETKNPDDLRYQLIVTDSQKSMDWTRLNTYGLNHAKGIYENWRKQTNAKRVVNLTRSTYVSGQRYGVVAWSGDISAKWSVLKDQITEGIKFCMSGLPYWTLDIGGFFTVKDKVENRGCEQAGNPSKLWFWNGDYNDGVHDLGYRELYVRWLQYAVFLPIFRAHGTDTPREPWHFGKPGEIFYDTILSFIRLRYRLMPYIYASAAAVTLRNDTMMRSLMFDFPQDENVQNISGSYMFGRALLICPVTEPMYYGPESTPLPDKKKNWSVYLPDYPLWYDYWTNNAYRGGRTVECDAPITRIPLFVKAGSIIPTSEPLTYADERNGEASTLTVYDGVDGEFTLYNDEGDGYAYEHGVYSLIPMRYVHRNQTLTFGKAEGQYPYQTHFNVVFVTNGCIEPAGSIVYKGEEMAVRLR
jgi:alpha-D-xyloside xylohydrolase